MSVAHYQVNDNVMCLHRGHYYKAKIVKIEEKDFSPRYFIHYHGWSKRHDEWISGTEAYDKFKSIEEYGKDKEADEGKEMLSVGKKRRLSKKSSSCSTSSSSSTSSRSSASSPTSTAKTNKKVATPKIRKDSSSTISSNTSSPDDRLSTARKVEKRKVDENKDASHSNANDVSPSHVKEITSAKRICLSPEKEQEPSIPDIIIAKPMTVNIPIALAQLIQDDSDYLDRQYQLVRLPAKFTVQDIIAEYLVDLELISSSSEFPGLLNIKSVEGFPTIQEFAAVEVVKQFNAFLASRLLFTCERPQYSEMVSENSSAGTFPKNDNGELIPSKIYGFVHLLRFCALAAEHLPTMFKKHVETREKAMGVINDILGFLDNKKDRFYNFDDIYYSSSTAYERSLPGWYIFLL